MSLMTSKSELAAQRCADLANGVFRARTGRDGCYRAVHFLAKTTTGSQEALYLYVERVDAAITAYEAGDKTALDEFRLVEPVDIVSEVIAGEDWPTLDPDKAGILFREKLAEKGLEIVEIGRAERG